MCIEVTWADELAHSFGTVCLSVLMSTECHVLAEFRLTCLSAGLVMVLTAAFEFDPRSNKEAIIRPTDNIEVPQVWTVHANAIH